MYSRQGYGINSQTALGAAYILNYKGCLNAKVQLSINSPITPYLSPTYLLQGILLL
jgi:hypothetical protein